MDQLNPSLIVSLGILFLSADPYFKGAMNMLQALQGHEASAMEAMEVLAKVDGVDSEEARRNQRFWFHSASCPRPKIRPRI